MVVIICMLFQGGLTGSAWGGWPLYPVEPIETSKVLDWDELQASYAAGLFVLRVPFTGAAAETDLLREGGELSMEYIKNSSGPAEKCLCGRGIG